MDKQDTYYTYEGNEEAALRNGSFVVTRAKTGLSWQWMNGDCMGNVTLPIKGHVRVDTKMALRLLPKVCGGKGC